MSEQIRIVLVDDHSVVRQGLRVFLEAQIDFIVVGEASSGEEAISVVKEQVPDVVLMDLAMPGMDGIEAIRQVKRISPNSQVVALTSYQEDEYIFPTLRAGALSYVLKDIHARDLAETVRKAVRGESVLHTNIATRVVRELRGDRRELPNLYAELSERERDVLRLIAQGDANATIAHKLVISEQTVKGHVSNILSKLQLSDRTQAAVFAWQHGFMRRANPNN